MRMNKNILHDGFTRVSQKFCIILVIWGTILPLWVLLLESWRWQAIWMVELFLVLLTPFVSMTQSTALKYKGLSLYNLTWSSTFLQSERNFFNHISFKPVNSSNRQLSLVATLSTDPNLQEKNNKIIFDFVEKMYHVKHVSSILSIKWGNNFTSV